MHVVVTMAGRSRRFTEAGVQTPKWAIDLDGRPILAHAVDSLTVMFDAGATCSFVVLDDPAHLEALDRCRAAIGVESKVVKVAAVPPGQGWSADAACAHLPQGDPMAVWNIDTAVEPTAMASVPLDGDWLSLTEQPGDHWSFAEIAADGRVARTAEKERISPWVSIGLYGFESVATYRSVVRAGETAHLRVRDELYIAPLYNLRIEAGAQVGAHRIPAEALTPLGTPAEVLAACTRHGWAVPAELAHLTGDSTG